MANAGTVITSSTVIRGRIEGSEDLDVQGQVEGQIQIEGAVKIDADARVEASISATSIYVHGILVGDGAATDTIHLTSDARVVGDLTAQRIIIDDGAKIRGLVDMGPSPAAPAPRRAGPSKARTGDTSASVTQTDEADRPATAAKKASAKKAR